MERIKKLIPYIITSTIITSGYSLVFSTPFIKDVDSNFEVIPVKITDLKNEKNEDRFYQTDAMSELDIEEIKKNKLVIYGHTYYEFNKEKRKATTYYLTDEFINSIDFDNVEDYSSEILKLPSTTKVVDNTYNDNYNIIYELHIVDHFNTKKVLVKEGSTYNTLQTLGYMCLMIVSNIAVKMIIPEKNKKL